MPKQYCRYCSYAEDWGGEGTNFVCFANAPCGDNGNGIFYSAAKAKAVNRCKYYGYCGIDIFTNKEYQPRGKREESPCDYVQTSLLQKG